MTVRTENVSEEQGRRKASPVLVGRARAFVYLGMGWDGMVVCVSSGC